MIIEVFPRSLEGAKHVTVLDSLQVEWSEGEWTHVISQHYGGLTQLKNIVKKSQTISDIHSNEVDQSEDCQFEVSTLRLWTCKKKN